MSVQYDATPRTGGDLSGLSITTAANLGGTVGVSVTIDDAVAPSKTDVILALTSVINELERGTWPPTSLVALPAGFAFDVATYPMRITELGSVFAETTPIASRFPAALFAGPTYYVDKNDPNASNTNSGFVPNRPLKSIWRAHVLGAALGTAGTVPYQVAIAPGDYDRSDGWADCDNISGAFGTNGVRPRQPCYVYRNGNGRVRTGTYKLGLNWTLNATYGAQGVWDAAIPAGLDVTLICDMFNLDTANFAQDGVPDYSENTKRADVATVAASAEGWFSSGVAGTLSVKRIDGGRPSDTNTRVFLSVGRACPIDAWNIYIKDIEFEGGTVSTGSGTVHMLVASTNRVAAFENVKASYGRDLTAVIYNSFAFDLATNGLTISKNCYGSKAQSDTFNYHAAGNIATNIVDIDCRSRDTGRAGTTSSNNLTAHETVKAISINFDGSGAAGGAVRHIDTSQMLVLGANIASDRGDVIFGGAIPPTAFNTSGTAVMWCIRTAAIATGRSYSADTGTTINLRDVSDGVGVRVANGTIQAF